jgi:hypothetical protein
MAAAKAILFIVVPDKGKQQAQGKGAIFADPKQL